MKVKKLFALILAAVLAVSVLTACGGGSGGSANIGEVSRIAASQGVDAPIKSSSNLNRALSQTASYMKQINRFDNSTASAYISSLREYPIVSGSRVITGSAAAGSSLEGLTEEQALALTVVALEQALKSEGLGDYIAAYYVASTTVTANNGVLYYVLGVEVEFSGIPQ